MNRQFDKITAIYTRIGAGGIDPNTFTELQRDTLMRYAEEQGFQNIEVFSDTGFNGLSNERPEFHKLRAAIAEGKVDRLVVLNLTRLYRDYTKCCHFIEGPLTQHHVDLYAVQDDITPQHPFASYLPALLSKGGVR